MMKTRFAPSPTGYLHIGGARTALYSWAYARRHGGAFVLRIEDTDLERSTEESVQAILDGMRWLGLDWDEGPVRQTDRLHRYREVADRLLREDKAYYCYSTRAELDALREAQRARGEKPRYDGRWRPENAARLGLKPVPGVQPVLRFRNPPDGVVEFDDLVKGRIAVANEELDDLVILRGDGVPTYNFGVVVDDVDMGITHVIRGDDHVNNTPRQINIYRAIGAALPQFAHVPMILGSDGERLSKRHGAVSVMQYHEDGFLPEALINYLARLGWSHGDAEIFSVDQFVQWFDLGHVSHSPAQFSPEKLRWLNQQYVKTAADDRLAGLVGARLSDAGIDVRSGPELALVVGILKSRSETIEVLADEAMMFYAFAQPSADLLAAHVTPAVMPALKDLLARFGQTEAWTAAVLAEQVKAVLKTHNLKMPALAMAIRTCVFGRTQTPDLATVLAIAGRQRVLERMGRHVE